MKIIQSFALFDEGSPYMEDAKDKSHIYLYFYSFFLSFIELKKRYGDVTMYCNQKAYDVFIKFIPYDKIVILENKNSMDFWNVYKLDVIRTIDDDLIHVDSDVFIFDDFFDGFIEGKDDILIQNIMSIEDNPVNSFGFENKDFLAQNNIFTKQYDGRSVNCGILGLRKKVFEKYFNAVDIIYKELLLFIEANNSALFGQTLIIEELLLYLIAIENNFEFNEIYPYDLILKYGFEKAGTMRNYYHVWKESKFKKEIVNEIKEKIVDSHPDYHSIMLEYDDWLKKSNIIITYR